MRLWFSRSLKTWTIFISLAGLSGPAPRWGGESYLDKHMDTWINPDSSMAASKGSVTVTKKHSISTPTLILVPASNQVETQAWFLGWLVSHFEKRNICFYVSILMLSILRPFQPFRNALFNHSSVFFFLFKGLSSSLWFPLHLKKSINNPDENRLDIPELWNQQILFKPCWWRSRRSQGGEDREPGRGECGHLPLHVNPVVPESSGSLVDLTTPGHLECK